MALDPQRRVRALCRALGIPGRAPAGRTGRGRKGKVERPIRYCRQSFFYGRDFVSDADLNAQAFRCMESVANVRRHRTTGESPQARFERDERNALKPLAPQPFPRLGVPSHDRRRRAVVGPLILVERRPLSAYSEAVR